MGLSPTVSPCLGVTTARRLLLSGILICPRRCRIYLVVVCSLQSYCLFLLCTPGCHSSSDHSPAKIEQTMAAGRTTESPRSISFSSPNRTMRFISLIDRCASTMSGNFSDDPAIRSDMQICSVLSKSKWTPLDTSRRNQRTGQPPETRIYFGIAAVWSLNRRLWKNC